jgi:hypothetical protein
LGREAARSQEPVQVIGYLDDLGGVRRGLSNVGDLKAGDGAGLDRTDQDQPNPGTGRGVIQEMCGIDRGRSRCLWMDSVSVPGCGVPGSVIGVGLQPQASKATPRASRRQKPRNDDLVLTS